MRARRDDAMDARGEMTGAMTKDVQVAAKPRRRTYTAEYKRRIHKRGRRVHDAGRDRGAVTAGRVVLLPPGRVAPGPRARRAGGADPEETWPPTAAHRSS